MSEPLASRKIELMSRSEDAGYSQWSIMSEEDATEYIVDILGVGGGRNLAKCTCPAFGFKKGDAETGGCKHTEYILEHLEELLKLQPTDQEEAEKLPAKKKRTVSLKSRLKRIAKATDDDGSKADKAWNVIKDKMAEDTTDSELVDMLKSVTVSWDDFVEKYGEMLK